MRVLAYKLLLFFVFFSLSAPLSAESVQYLDQGWTKDDREWWYTVPQGSSVIPLKWLQALKVAGTSEPFLSNANTLRYNYIPNPQSSYNPYGLPLGFAAEDPSSPPIYRRFFGKPDRYGPWAGLTCAACHTAELTFNGVSYRVDGGPALADYQGYMAALLDALKAVTASGQVFDDFAAGVLGASAGANQKSALKEDAATLASWIETVRDRSATHTPYGFGRVDAVGHILNKIDLIISSGPLPPNPADAPVSYPHLWNTHQQERVQWNGMAENGPDITLFSETTDLGAIGRNAGEVAGVWADIDLQHPDYLLKWFSDRITGYKTSINIRNLIAIERKLATLRSPIWPKEFGFDESKAAAGKIIYIQLCANCHKVLAPDDLKTKIPFEQTIDGKTYGSQSLRDIGTDIWMACNAHLHRTSTGILKGRHEKDLIGDVIPDEDASANLLLHVVIGSIGGQAADIIGSTYRSYPYRRTAPAAAAGPRALVIPVREEELPVGTHRTRARDCASSIGDLKYKARPLNGIWATGPYLHNGSVPTLYDLLLPAKLRPLYSPAGTAPAAAAYRAESFYTGNREFDPVHVGYKTGPAPGAFLFRVMSEDGKRIPGNANSGHEFGTDLSASDRMALLEYLKSL